jgi:Protein of unknown function (DUF4012)
MPVQAAGGAEERGSKKRRKRRPRVALWVTPVLVVLGAWVAYAAVELVHARREAQAGIDRLEALRDTMTPESLLAGDDLDALRDARSSFASAHDHATNPALVPMRFVPFVGRQVRSVDALTGAADDVSGVAIEKITAARTLVDSTDTAPPQRVAIVTDLSRIAGDAHTDLEAIDLGPREGLVGPLSRAHRRFADELDSLRDSAENVTLAGAGVESMLRGPGRYLVLAANNSEMRVGSAGFLSVGVMSTDNGQLDLGAIDSTTAYPVRPDAVPLTGDMADNWGWLQPNVEWRNLGSSPRFDANAALAQQMWAAATGETVDGVVALDIVALRALIEATGPVVVDGQTITQDNVQGYLMRTQYEGATGVSQDPRREHLSAVAQAVVARIQDGGWDVTTLVSQLAEAVEGRHLMLWSSDPSAQRGWEAVRAAGVVGGDSLLLGLHNRGGNKLDQFLALDATITSHAVDAGTAVDVTVRIRNDAPTGLPQYVAGPYAGAVDSAEGRYQGLLVCDLPKWARDVTISGIGERVASGPDGDAQVIAAYLQADRGRELTATIAFVLPAGADRLRIEPSARYPVVTWNFGDDRWDDHKSREIVVSNAHGE